jgi:hypothetical protein
MTDLKGEGRARPMDSGGELLRDRGRAGGTDRLMWPRLGGQLNLLGILLGCNLPTLWTNPEVPY